MKTLKLLIFFISIVCATASAQNNDTVFVKESEAIKNLNLYLQYTDINGAVSFDSIKQLSPAAFKRTNSDNIPNFGFSNKQYWFKLILKNNGVSNKKIFEITFPFLNKIEVYIPTLGIYKKYKTGDHYKFSQRAMKHRNFLFPVTFYDKEAKEIYVHVTCNGEYTAFPVSLVSQEELSQRDYLELFADGLYYGTMLFAFFLSFFLGITLKERTHFYYLFYIVGAFLFQFALDGLAFQYLFYNLPWLANHIVPMGASFALFWLLQFTMSYFNIKALNKKIYNYLIFLSAIFVIIHILSYLPSPVYGFSILLTSFATILENISLLYVAIYCYRRNINQAQYFLVAFSLLIIAIIVVQLKNFGLLPANALTTEAIQIGSLIEIILLSFALAGRVKTLNEEKQKAQQQLLVELEEKARTQEQANIELERKVNERTHELNEQKLLVEEKNRDITSGINYARNIQYAILPSESYIKQHLPESFILYKPKDIVSGDFYWYTNVNTSGANSINLNVIAAADCTGHGVPGAFMSIIGNNLLNETIKNPEINNPGDVLHYLNKNIGFALNKNSNKIKLNDGMDIGLCAYNSNTKQLMYAGANRPLWLYKAAINEIEEVKPTKTSIGGHSSPDQVYENHVITLEAGDMFYIFSDGIVDQFGGEKGKKLMTKNFKSFLTGVAQKNVETQYALIEQYFETWKGDFEQVDDILVIGVRI